MIGQQERIEARAPAGPDSARMEEMCRSALNRARRSGAEATDISIVQATRTEACVRAGEPENLTRSRTTDVIVTVYDAGRKGVARAHGLSPDMIAQSVDKALAVARFTRPDPANGLADLQDEVKADTLPELGLWNPWDVGAGDLFSLALEAEAAGLASDDRIAHCERASASTTAKVAVRANSNGFVGRMATTHHQLSATFIAQDDAGQQRAGDYDLRCDPAHLHGSRRIGESAAQRALARLSPRKLPTRTCPVLFTPDIASGFWHDVLHVLSGPAIYGGRSFLAGRLGGTLMPDFVRMTERPHLWHGIGSRHHDDDGLLKRDEPIVSGGVLVRYLLDSYAARRLSLPGTRNAGGFSNVVIEGQGQAGFADMVARLGTGLIVTSIMGHGFDAASGDYSVGAAGLWVDRGEVVHAVDGVTIAAHATDMLGGIVGIGSDQDVREKIRSGSVLFDRMTVAGS